MQLSYLADSVLSDPPQRWCLYVLATRVSGGWHSLWKREQSALTQLRLRRKPSSSEQEDYLSTTSKVRKSQMERKLVEFLIAFQDVCLPSVPQSPNVSMKRLDLSLHFSTKNQTIQISFVASSDVETMQDEIKNSSGCLDYVFNVFVTDWL
ncbi:hypothetical protein J6590_035449, partial [Homalodisca vitripennis]